VQLICLNESRGSDTEVKKLLPGGLPVEADVTQVPIMTELIGQSVKLFAPSEKVRASVIDSAWRLAKVNSYDIVYDFGCSDGAVVEHTAFMCGCKCVGVGFDRKQIDLAREKINSRGPPTSNVAEIVDGNTTSWDDLKNATVIFCNFRFEDNETLKQEFEELYKNGCRIVCSGFRLDFLSEDAFEEIRCDGSLTIYLYKCKTAEMAEIFPMLKTLDQYLDPFKNPALLPLFNVSIVALVIVLISLFFIGAESIHLYVMGVLAIGLLLSINYFIAVVQDTMSLQERQAKKSINLGKDYKALERIKQKHLNMQSLKSVFYEDSESEADSDDENIPDSSSKKTQ